jgi:hypothetical protein
MIGWNYSTLKWIGVNDICRFMHDHSTTSFLR